MDGINITPQLLAYAVIFGILTVASYYDLRTHRIPNLISLIGIALAILICIFKPLVPWVDSIIGAIALGGGLAGLSFFSKEQIGMGDAKMFVFIGLLLGLKAGLVLLAFAICGGGVLGLLLLLLRRGNLKTSIPFAPIILVVAFLELNIKY